MFKRLAAIYGLGATLASVEVVGKVGVDWVGNDIVIEAVPDPKVKGVACHIACFERSFYDRLSNGNWSKTRPGRRSTAARPDRPAWAISTGDRQARTSSARAPR